MSGSHIMISYCWSQQQKMRELGRKLKERRIPIWMDVEKMEGNILDCVAKAVEDASVIVVGLSPEYFKSDSCRKECEYAVKLKKQMVFVLAVDGYTPNGWLGLVVGNALYYNPWKNPEDTTSFLKYVARLHEPQTSGNNADTSPLTTKIVARPQSDLDFLGWGDLKPSVNDRGRQTQLGANGNRYCGGRLPFNCGCCDGCCGPNSGCSCESCMRLEIKVRKLPAGCYINRAGVTVKRSSGKLYCGRRNMVGVPHCDGYCGPTNGPNCHDCQTLEKLLAAGFYR